MKPGHFPTEHKDGDSNLYRQIPSLHDLLLTPDFAALLENAPRTAVIAATRVTLARLKQEIGEGHHTAASLASTLACVHATVADQLAQASQYSLRRVINATGVLLHTNLGRAPLSASALKHILETAGGYCNLEFDLDTGERSRRDVHAEQLIPQVLRPEGADLVSQSAVVVNNCAAATFLALKALAEGGEVIVSRGELIEIGGGFRIPEILAQSGTILREVGTTNRTRLSDYADAISPATRLILRVHQSNFKMEGFTERPALHDLVSLGKRCQVAVFDDQGTGLLTSLAHHGIRCEPTLPDSVRGGADLIAASGDKLLGGPQCGILIGRADLVERIRKHSLYRAFRVDKLTYAALEATLMEYAADRLSAIPLQRMLHASADEIFRRCEWICQQVCSDQLDAKAVLVQSVIGGGAAPTARLQSTAVSLGHLALPPLALLSALRRFDPPVIGRIHEDRVLLDLRTVEPQFDTTLVSLLQALSPA